MKTAEIRNKIPDTSHFINMQKFNWLIKISFDTRMKEAEKNLVSKTEVNNAVNLGEKNWKKTPEKRQTFSLGYFLGKSHFESDEAHYLAFPPVFECFKTLVNINRIIVLKFKVLSEESIILPVPDNSHNPGLIYIDNAKIWVKFDGSCFKQENVIFNHKTILNFYIVYEINSWSFNLDSKFTLRDSLFGAVKLTNIVRWC